jgi:short-subunit dehydrogenase
VQLSSISGLIGIPTQGIYAASEFAMEGTSEALAEELKPFGISVTLVEPRIYATDFIGQSMHLAGDGEFDNIIAAYQARIMEWHSWKRSG